MKVLLMALLLAGCATPPPSQHDVWMKARTETVQVVASDGEGTGVVVSDRCVLTVAHVADKDTVAVVTASGKHYVMKRVAYDSASDVAAVCADTPIDSPKASLGPSPATYDSVFTIGFPLGQKFILTEGRWQGGDMITAQCAPGNSGGGVFDGSGRVIGLVDTVLTYEVRKSLNIFPHLCGIVNLASITALLDRAHVEYGHD